MAEFSKIRYISYYHNHKCRPFIDLGLIFFQMCWIVKVQMRFNIWEDFFILLLNKKCLSELLNCNHPHSFSELPTFVKIKTKGPYNFFSTHQFVSLAFPKGLIIWSYLFIFNIIKKSKFLCLRP